MYYLDFLNEEKYWERVAGYVPFAVKSQAIKEMDRLFLNSRRGKKTSYRVVNNMRRVLAKRLYE